MHWRAPTTMLATFAIGVAFAVGHHLFYQSLDGTPVERARLSQQYNIGIGTAFTFLVRSFLSVAVGIAFVQVLWRRLLSEHIAVSRIDSMTQLLTSIFDLVNLKTVWQYPLLAFLALISWTIPIAAIVPPGSLSVRTLSDPLIEYTMNNLPLLDFTKSTFSVIAANTVQIGLIFEQCLEGSATGLYQLVQWTAIQGEIPPSKAPAPNSSYSLQFFGPSIQCQPTATTVLSDFESLFGCNFTKAYTDPDGCDFGYSYLAWTPGTDARVPFDNASITDDSINFRHVYGDSSCAGLATLGGFGIEPAMIYIGTNSGNYSWSILNCSLYNASYTTKVNYQDSVETISTSTQLLNSLPFEAGVVQETELVNPVLTEAQTVYLNYEAVMESFGKIMVGGIWYVIAMYSGPTKIDSTTVLSTNLANCVELGGNDSTTSLATAAEQLFQNITVGLFSKPEYVSTNGSDFKPTNVTIYTFPNTYVYSWSRLTLAYGLAVFFTAVSVLIGGLALLASKQSYQYNFSTIMRVTRQKAIDVFVRPEDTKGQAPLPDHIGQARIIAGHEMDYYDQEGQQQNAAAEMTQQPRQSIQETQPLNRDDGHDDEDDGASDSTIDANDNIDDLRGQDGLDEVNVLQFQEGEQERPG